MSGKYTPKVGDRVRVVLEGTVGYAGNVSFIVGGARSSLIVPADEHVISVERLPDPEPDWQTRDVVVDADGVCYLRDGLGAWRNFAGVAYATDFPTRPLTLLVRDGKPVLS